MAKFNLGDRIKNIRTGELGYVVKVLPPNRGLQMYRVKYDERDIENNERSANLMLNVDLSDPFERVRQNLFGYYTEYLKDNTSFKIKSSNNSTISSLKASKTLFKPYQFKPLLKFLNSDNRRVLIADEVGLGKTIEAGHIMLELKARGEFRNALVVCPMALKAKWTTELNEKFGLDFINIDDKDQLIHELRYHPGYVKAVLNYEKLYNKDVIDFIEERHIKFSIIVCDESHRLRNSGTQLYKGAKKIVALGDGVVFMTATPIMLNRENLYNQLHLLDPNIYDNKEIFQNNANLNEPFVCALTQLNKNVKWSVIKKQLIDTEVTTYNKIGDMTIPVNVKIDDYFREYPIYREIVKDLSLKEDKKLKAKIQYNLAEMSPMSTIFSRTRKTDVTQDWSQAERNTVSLGVNLTQEESAFYNIVLKDYINDKGGVITYDEYGRPKSGALGLVTLKRQLSSSIWATVSDDKSLDNGIDVYEDYIDSKFDALLININDAFSKGKRKIIVFAIFKKTIKYLNIRLKKAGYKPVMIYGDSNINKYDVLHQFEFDDSVEVLLSSEVGSEGLDMQFCNCLVNYDLPWNPMVVEQRIGRIDRFGQESPKVNIFNIVVKDTIVEDIFSRLLDRIGIFRRSIGDLEAILDKELEQNGKRVTIKEALKSIENDYYSDKLTKEEAEKKRLAIEQAIENERKTIEELEKGLTNTLTNDYYFQSQIKKIDENNAYVTSIELYQFIIQLLKDHLTTCSLEKTDQDGIYLFRIPKSDPEALRHFLNDNIPSNEDSKKLIAGYISEIRDKLELKVTFDQDLAFKDKMLSFINIYHPIIQAGVVMYEKAADKSRRTFFFEMDASTMPDTIHAGFYLLAIFKISVSRVIFDKKVVTDSLYPILYDIQEQNVIDDHELAETFMGKAQIHGRYAPLTEDMRIKPEIVDDVEYDLKYVIDTYLDEYTQDQQMRINNNKKMRYQQTEQYYNSRIAIAQQNIDNQENALHNKDEELRNNAERILPAMRKNLLTLQQERDDELKKINRDVQLRVIEEIKSINLVKLV